MKGAALTPQMILPIQPIAGSSETNMYWLENIDASCNSSGEEAGIEALHCCDQLAEIF